jgi:phenylacetic acid degradation operon negative regulatory protein
LPAEILPPDWPGTAARELCAKAYTALLAPSEQWLTSQDLPPANPGMRHRFQKRVTELA